MCGINTIRDYRNKLGLHLFSSVQGYRFTTALIPKRSISSAIPFQCYSWWNITGNCMVENYVFWRIDLSLSLRVVITWLNEVDSTLSPHQNEVLRCLVFLFCWKNSFMHAAVNSSGNNKENKSSDNQRYRRQGIRLRIWHCQYEIGCCVKKE